MNETIKLLRRNGMERLVCRIEEEFQKLGKSYSEGQVELVDLNAESQTYLMSYSSMRKQMKKTKSLTCEELNSYDERIDGIHNKLREEVKKKMEIQR